MDAKLQTFFSELAKCAGLTIEFADGSNIRISGYQDADTTFYLIPANQPDSELIFAILHKIGIVHVQTAEIWPMRFPWFLDRSYENEVAGDVVYKSRRFMNQKFTKERRADLWALLVYPQIPCAIQLAQFLRGHPEKMEMMPRVWYGLIKAPVQNKFSTCLRILYAMLAAKLPCKKS